ncbi:MAG: hypothetical protein M3463_22405 [Verrucomicrobiota bacterium]|nr:hypothetical protein [Verrucomicrobiota bacterium]
MCRFSIHRFREPHFARVRGRSASGPSRRTALRRLAVSAPENENDVRLHGGFVIVDLEFAKEPLVDAMGREAIARTAIQGKSFTLLIRSELNARELSVTLYHEILEAASVGSIHPPPV